MTFYFGILAEIDIGVSTVALTLTILFLICFDLVTRIIEYSVRNSQIYNKMLQKMYKELMTMGFVTLLINLYTAADQSSVFARYSTEIDFIGYVTFFVAIFFVAHALYIMLLSMRTSRVYEHLHRIKVAQAIEIYTESQQSSWQRFLFSFPYIPLSSVRQKLEFKIIHSLFRDSYWLPTHFDYGSYLSRSFEKYSLKMINIGWSSWLIMMALGLLNFLRVEYFSSGGFLSCTRLDNDSNTTDRRLFNNVNSMEESSNDLRYLQDVSQSCLQLNVTIFLICGSVVVLYAFILFITGRFYYQRLIERTGISCLNDYPKFLMFEESISLKISSAQRERKLEIEINDKYSKKSKRRMSINTLRKNVNILLKEPQLEEEEKVFQKISSTIDQNIKRRRSLFKKNLSDVTKKVSPLISSTTSIRRQFKSLNSFGSMRSAASNENSEHIGDDESKIERQGLYSRQVSDVDESKRVDRDVDEKPLIYRKESDPSSARSLFKKKASKQGSMKNLLVKNIGSSMRHLGIEKKEIAAPSPPPVRRKNLVINVRNDDKGVYTNPDVDSLTSIEQFKLFKLKEYDAQSIKYSEKKNEGLMMSYMRSHSHTFNGGHKHDDMKLSEDLSDIYFFENPDLYFRAVEYAIVLNSLYLSLWACNFISVVQANFEDSWIYQIVMLVPLLFVLPLLGEIVKVSSLLEAIAELDIDVIGAVLEDMEEKNSLILELRQKILNRIVGEMDDKKVIVSRLFEEIDIDHNGLISRFELRKMLRALRLHYSDAKFMRLYNAIDDDLNGSISELELTLLIFPDMIEDENIKQRKLKLRQASQDIDKTSSNYSSRFISYLNKYAHVAPSEVAPTRHAPVIPHHLPRPEMPIVTTENVTPVDTAMKKVDSLDSQSGEDDSIKSFSSMTDDKTTNVNKDSSMELINNLNDNASDHESQTSGVTRAGRSMSSVEVIEETAITFENHASGRARAESSSSAISGGDIPLSSRRSHRASSYAGTEVMRDFEE